MMLSAVEAAAITAPAAASFVLDSTSFAWMSAMVVVASALAFSTSIVAAASATSATFVAASASSCSARRPYVVVYSSVNAFVAWRVARFGSSW
jgi:hypothetical protein